MSKLGNSNMAHHSSDVLTTHMWKKKTQVETWYLVLKLCLCIKGIVLLNNFTGKIGTYEFSVRFYKICKNVKIKLGSMLKNWKLNISCY